MKVKKIKKIKKTILLFGFCLAAGLLFFCVEPGGKAAAKATYQVGIKAFPGSYKAKLIELKKKHPAWSFVAVNTGLSIDKVAQKEKNRNTIQSLVPSTGQVGYGAPFSYLSTEKGDYDWKTDTYRLCDGSNWYRPNHQVLCHYLDPRNFLDEQGIFMFLGYDYQKNQKYEAVKNILKGSFMEGSYSYKLSLSEYRKLQKKEETQEGKKKKAGSNAKKAEGNEKKREPKFVTVTEEYAKTFMDAGKEFRISPYFLATRALQEIGSKKSNAVTGTCRGYVGYYNFFNIGANDTPGTVGSAAMKGLYFAKGGAKKEKTYLRPWNTPRQAIRGGADFMAENYMASGQNTIYFQKFSVTDKSFLYWHQYMSNIQAPWSEGRKLHDVYKNSQLHKERLTFYIPVYSNLPKEPVTLPKVEGNPNAYVKMLMITDQKGKNLSRYLNQKFDYKKGKYILNLPQNVKIMRLDARPVSSYAKIVQGAGTYTYKDGKKSEIVIVCRAQNGEKREYKVKVFWEAAKEAEKESSKEETTKEETTKEETTKEEAAKEDGKKAETKKEIKEEEKTK